MLSTVHREQDYKHTGLHEKNLNSYATTEDLDLKLDIFIMHSRNWEKVRCYHSAVDTLEMET